MKIKLPSSSTILVLSLMAGLFLSACSPSAGKLNHEGNDAFARQSFDEAQIAYQNASMENPDPAEPYYNLANALYRKGGFDQALDPLLQALSRTSDQDLAQNSLYNLGNNASSLEDWEAAIDAYKQALLLNPNDQDAKYNLELALQHLQQQQQDQQQNQDQGENQDQDQNQSQDQSQDGDQNQDQNQGQDGDQQSDQNPQDENSSGGPQTEPNQNGQGNGQEQREDNSGDQPWATPQPGQKMTEEQAKQLLAALLQNAQTLQEKLGDILTVRALPPIQDW